MSQTVTATLRNKLEMDAKPLVRKELGPLGDAEVEYFCGPLGLSWKYFAATTPEDIARHTMLLFAAKFRARVAESGLVLDISDEAKDNAIYICPSKESSDPREMLSSASSLVEERIEERYLHEAWKAYGGQAPNAGLSAGAQKASQQQVKDDAVIPCEGYVVEAFRSFGQVARSMPIRLRLFLVQRPKYTASQGANGFRSLACSQFLHFIKNQPLEEYEKIVMEATTATGCVVTVKLPSEAEYDPESTRFNEEQDVVVRIAYRRGTTHSFFPISSQLYRMLGFRARVKALWPFKNHIDLHSIWMSSIEPLPYAELKKRVTDFVHHLSLSYILPRTPLTKLVGTRQLGAGEHAYAYCGMVFAHHFLTLLPREEDAIKSSLFPEMGNAIGGRMKSRLRQNMLTEARLAESITKYPELISVLHDAFVRLHSPTTPKADRFDTKAEGETAKLIMRTVPNEIDQRVLLCFLSFNKWVLKTNFFLDNRNVLAFRLDPRCLNPLDYTERPYGIFLIVGSCFRGFHVRFRDVARGGIRLIQSSNEQAYAINVATLFDENYALALTQQRKNKDIPEGGSKGTILLARDHQDKGHVAFDQYIDGLLDLILPNPSVKDYLGSQELLYFGPDEGTADKMDRAAMRAKERGYPLWRAATTGKSIAMGGIPHDTYGMTTRSVHQYVLGFCRKLGLKEADLRKLQTGGPDGDLGSNEILISCDKTCTIVDGSGVLHDPSGLNRGELARLAKSRQMARHFDQKLLGPGGFFVDVRDVDRQLPDGTVVQSGLQFRNTFHLDERAAADLFVPCGGRPESVNVDNVHMLYTKGEPHIKIIVEGANLFFTQEARLKLESSGVHLVKDASANKGGVTSSSLEVLTALALEDDEFKKLMTAPPGTPPEEMPAFYRAYVVEVQSRIEENARLEFECLWSEWKRTSQPMCVLTDIVSQKINALNDQIQGSSLWLDQDFRRMVMARYVPKTLLEHLGIDLLMKRVPESYIRSIFGAFLAAQYVYLYGTTASEFSFFDYITQMQKGKAKL